MSQLQAWFVGAVLVLSIAGGLAHRRHPLRVLRANSWSYWTFGVLTVFIEHVVVPSKPWVMISSSMLLVATVTIWAITTTEINNKDGNQ